MNRKGISFTLTLVVIGVVLLMTALTVIVLGGGEIGGFLQRGGGALTSGSIQQGCSNLAEKIDNNYCSWYARLPTDGEPNCADVNRESTGPYEVQVSNVPCNFIDAANSGGEIEVTEGAPAAVNLQAVLTNEQTLVNPTDSSRGYDINNDGEGGADAEQYRPVVEVGGTLYDCIQEDQMDSLCPAASR